MTYRILWEIDIDAESPREAAQRAQAHQRNHYSSAGVFDVFDEDGNKVRLDLEEDAE